LGHVYRTGPPYRGCDITSALLTYLICSSNGTLVQVTVSVEKLVSQICPIRFMSLDWRRLVWNALGSNCKWGFTSITSVPRGKCRDSSPIWVTTTSKYFLGATSHDIKELYLLLREGAFMFCMTTQNVNRFVRLEVWQPWLRILLNFHHLCVCVCRRYGLINGFIDHLYPSLGTISNYSAVVNLDTLQITTASTEPFSSLLCLHQPFLGNGFW
jgi:hypothetical protein